MTGDTAVALPFVDELELVVPDNIQVMTPYVIREQRDWFEIEARFVRTILEPGMQVIDVGANFGVYAIPMANVVGETGHVWAFEPCRNTFDHLVQSVKRNSLNNITLVRSGLGERQGIVRLATSSDAELNAITADEGVAGEIIDLTTLDTCMSELSITNVDFIKLDAEGYEAKVLEGGRGLLERFEPLVMFELRHNDSINMSLIEDFRRLGMNAFALIPGANVLVPFDPDAPLDSFRLNLFACTDERARQLQSRGFLVSNVETIDAETLDLSDARKHLLSVASVLDLPVIEVQKIESGNETPLVKDLLRCLAVESGCGTPAQRISTLRYLVDTCSEVTSCQSDIARLALLARAAQSLGEQRICVEAAIAALDLLKAVKARPHLMLSPLPSYDAVAPGARFHEWLVSGFLECFERTRAYSSFLLGDSSLMNQKILCDMGFAGPAMHRRLALIEERFCHSTRQASGAYPGTPQDQQVSPGPAPVIESKAQE